MLLSMLKLLGATVTPVMLKDADPVLLTTTARACVRLLTGTDPRSRVVGLTDIRGTPTPVPVRGTLTVEATDCTVRVPVMGPTALGVMEI